MPKRLQGTPNSNCGALMSTEEYDTGRPPSKAPCREREVFPADMGLREFGLRAV